MAKRITVCNRKDLPAGRAAAFDVEGRRIAVFHVGESYYALDDTCTHAGAPLCEGEVQGNKVVCPWHNAEFELTTGKALCPPASEGLTTYRVVVQGDDLQVEVPN